MNTVAYILHALSPLHAGVGQAAELIDLPIARLKGTGIPFLPGSSIKGVLRDARSLGEGNHENMLAVFGPDTEAAHEHAGALICTDARLIALPVRSFRGTFAYVTSPLLLTLAARDFHAPPPLPTVAFGRALVPEGCVLAAQKQIILQDLDLQTQPGGPALNGWISRIAPALGPPEAQSVFTRRFCIIDDETMTFLWETGTQIDQRIRIDPTTRTVANGALWLEESLPPETLLIGLFAAENSRRPGRTMTPTQVLDFALPAGEGQVLQFGGKSTVGRGRCVLARLPG
jgi:CRISPR-associated protein Cmr4